MSNPIHTPKTEAELIHLECLRRTAIEVRADADTYTGKLTLAYRRDVYNRLAKMHNGLLDKYGFDGTYLELHPKGD